MSRVLELFGEPTSRSGPHWAALTTGQICPFTRTKCFKVRKSDPTISIGSCTVGYGVDENPGIVCPNRFLERDRIFLDSIHLLTSHEPGNDLHVIPETAVPGGSIDYFLVSARRGKVQDFVGIEVQGLDTTGTVWPERERFLRDLELPHDKVAAKSDKPFGINWKMSAKTILVQLHHKIETFEHIGKKLVLADQDILYDYMRREFSFDHVANEARLGDSMHFHNYALTVHQGEFRLELASRKSTDAAGVARCLGLQSEARVELSYFVEKLEAALTPQNRLSLR